VVDEGMAVSVAGTAEGVSDGAIVGTAEEVTDGTVVGTAEGLVAGESAALAEQDNRKIAETLKRTT